MKLEHLTDEELLQNTERAATDEREATTRLLHHLCEVQRRRLFATVGCSSLFEYCLRVLKMSEPQAGRRVNAARMLKEFPEIEEKIQSGALSLTAVSQARVLFRREIFSHETKAEIVKELENQPSRKAEEILLSHSSRPASVKRDGIRPVTENFSEVRVTLDKATLEGLERLREIWSHKIPNASMADLVKAMVGFCREKLDPELQTIKIRVSTPAPEKRRVSADIRRTVWKRDKGVCTYKDPKSGRLCGSRFRLEIDHRIPFALGGKSTESNLRLRCRTHNQLHAIEVFGPGAPKSACS